jgi:chemotaxis protein MotB
MIAMCRILIAAVGILIGILPITSCVSNEKQIAREKHTPKTKAPILVNKKRLQDTISYLQTKVTTLGDSNAEVAYKLYKTSSELNIAKEYMIAQQIRLQQLQAFINQQKKSTERLKHEVIGAMVGYNSNELTVELKNGRVYVSMQDALLFASGSTKVSQRGKEALAKVATVLNKDGGLKIDIEGHTDNQPIKNQAFADNWSLSTARATTIAHILIDEYKVSPLKLIASGRAHYDPAAPNNTPEGRTKNRRTEIILEPKYDDIMEIMIPTAYR